MRDSVVFYKSFRDAIAKLSPEDQLRAYNAIFDYVFDDAEAESGIESAILLMAKPQIDANNKKYEAGKKGAEYGVKGGRPKKENPIETPIKPQENPMETPNVNDNENVNVNDKEIAATQQRAMAEARKKVVEAWNNTSFISISKLASDSTRGKMLTARIKEYGVEDVLKAVEIADKSRYLHEGSSKWFTFDWFVKPNNFPKVLEENYSDNGRASPSEEEKGRFNDIADRLIRESMGDVYGGGG